MNAPSAEMVEQAHGRLDDVYYLTEHAITLSAQAKEAKSGVPGKSADFYAGYALGVEAARVLLAGMPEAIVAKVSI